MPKGRRHDYCRSESSESLALSYKRTRTAESDKRKQQSAEGNLGMFSSWRENVDIDQSLAIHDSPMDYSEINRQRKLSWFLFDKEQNTLVKQIKNNSPDDLSCKMAVRRTVKLKETTGTTNGMTVLRSPQKCKTNVVKVPEDNCRFNVKQNTEYELKRTIDMQQKIIDHLLMKNRIKPLRKAHNFSNSTLSSKYSPIPCNVPISRKAKGLLETQRQSNAQGDRNEKIPNKVDSLSNKRHLHWLKAQQSRTDTLSNDEAQNNIAESHTPISNFAASSSGYKDATELGENLILCGNVNSSNNSDVDRALNKGIIEKESANKNRKHSDELNISKLLPQMSSSDDTVDSSDYEDVEDLEDDSFLNASIDSSYVDWTVTGVNHEKAEASVEENNIREHISQLDTPMTCSNRTASCSGYADVAELGTDGICSHSATQVDTRKNDFALSRENNENCVVCANRTDILLDTVKNIAQKGKSEVFKCNFRALFSILALCNVLVMLSGVSLTLLTVYKKQDLCFECKELSSLKTELHPFLKEDGRCCVSSVQQMLEILDNVTSKAQRASYQATPDDILCEQPNHDTIPMFQCKAQRKEKVGNVTRIAWEIKSDRAVQKSFESLGPGKNTLINIPVSGFYYLFSRVHYRSSAAVENFLTLGYSVILVRDNFEEKIDSIEDTRYQGDTILRHTSHLSFVHNFNESDSLYLRLDNEKYFDEVNTKVGLFFIKKQCFKLSSI